MNKHANEGEYFAPADIGEDGNENNDGKDKIVRYLKSHLFGLFFLLNKMKFSMAVHYHMLAIAIEGFQLLSIVLNDGSYSSMGPYNSSSP